jgi:hypothetical protein
MSRYTPALLPLAMAATSAGAASYSAKPVVPVSSRFITADIVWNCGPAACQGSTQESRPLVLCEGLARRAGRIDSFIVDGRALGADDLGRCNSAAKPAPTKSLAAE